MDTPEEARFCPNCGCALAGGPSSVGVRKVVTIVFCDLCDSTALAERLDAETFRRVLAKYLRSMSAVVERQEGAVAKFIGDAVMALFGVPTVRLSPERLYGLGDAGAQVIPGAGDAAVKRRPKIRQPAIVQQQRQRDNHRNRKRQDLCVVHRSRPCVAARPLPTTPATVRPSCGNSR